MMLWLLACSGDPQTVCEATRTVDAVDTGIWSALADIPYEAGVVRAQARWPQSGSAWPVAAFLHGAWDIAGTPVSTSSMRPAVDEGVVAVHMDFPGNAGTSGTNDHRGQGSRRAVEAVLRWAAGQLPDTNGCVLQDIAPDTNPSDLYVVGSSNGGNIAVAALADSELELPPVSGLILWETPSGPQFSNVELGISPTVYSERSCSWSSDSGITCTIPADTVTAGFVDEVEVLCFDNGGDGACGDGDVSIRGTVDLVTDTTFVSPSLAAAAEARSVLPEGWSGFEAATEWWGTRDAGRLAGALIRARPDLPILLLASEQDHVQSLSDHPHVFGLGQALQASGARWTRLNPGSEWLAENTVPNEPNLVLSLATPTANLLAESAETPGSTMISSAIRELSDRNAEDRW